MTLYCIFTNSRDGLNNYIEVGNFERSKMVKTFKGQWRDYGRNGFSLIEDNPASHEFGHILGGRDKYKNVDGVSRPIDSGWADNVMAKGSGKVDNMNMKSILDFATPECKDVGPKECKIVNINKSNREIR